MCNMPGLFGVPELGNRDQPVRGYMGWSYPQGATVDKTSLDRRDSEGFLDGDVGFRHLFDADVDQRVAGVDLWIL